MPYRLSQTIGRVHPRLRHCVLLITVGLLACSDNSPTATEFGAQFAPGGGGPPVRVTATDPTGADQGTTLDVKVFGSNFEPGSNASFRIDGVPPGLVKTNSTTFVSPDELIANITIDAGADLGLYDVEVTTPRGKKGVGTELFTVSSPSDVDYILTDWQGAVWFLGPVDAGIGPDGSLWFAAGGNKKNAPPEICVDLSRLVGGVPIDAATYDIFVKRVLEDPTSSGMVSVCSEARVHTRDHSIHPAEAQPVGTIEHAGGKIVLKDYYSRGGDSWEWRLQFDVEGALSHLPERGKGICIEHAAETTWHVYNDVDVFTDPPAGCTAAGATIDNVMRLTRFTRTEMTLVAEFIVPFRFSFVPKP